MKLSRRDSFLALAVGLAALVVYRQTLAPTVLPGDSGEFQFAAPLLGLAHPTGYPLYLLLGKLWTVLVPLGDMALRMNLLSAMLSAAAVGMLYLLGKRLGLGVAPSLLAALILAFSATFWSQAIRAEVYALNSLFTIVLLYVAATGTERGAEGTPGTMPGLQDTQHDSNNRRYWLPLLFVLGLSLTHHRMALLLVPALALLIWSREQATPHIGNPESRIPYPLSLFPPPAYALAFLLPLLLYLYIPLRAAATPYMRLAVGGGPELVLYNNTVSDFVAMVMGSVFRGSLAAPDGMQTVERLSMIANLLRQQIGLAGIALAALGLVTLARRTPPVALALALAYLAVVAFCFVYFIGDISDLFTPSYIIAALLAGAGAKALCDVAGRYVHAPGRAAVLAAVAMLPLALIAGNWQTLDLSLQIDTRSAWEELLRQPLPQRAVLVSNDRDEMTPMWYLQYVEGQRRDLVGMFPQIKPDNDFASLGALLDWLLARGQQPYLIKAMPGLEIKYRVQQEGNLSRVTGFAASPATPSGQPLGVFGDGAGVLSADVAGTAAPGAALTVTLYWRALSPLTEDYHVFVQLVNAGGERVAGSDHRPGGVFYPASVWSTSDVLADRHVLDIPVALPPGVYTLRTGMYRYPAMTRLALTGSGETMLSVGTVQVR